MCVFLFLFCSSSSSSSSSLKLWHENESTTIWIINWTRKNTFTRVMIKLWRWCVDGGICALCCAVRLSVPHDLCFRSRVHHGNGFRCGGGCKIEEHLSCPKREKKNQTIRNYNKWFIQSANTRNIEQFISTLTLTHTHTICNTLLSSVFFPFNVHLFLFQCMQDIHVHRFSQHTKKKKTPICDHQYRKKGRNKFAR